jgi:uncharacterized membrane protein
MNELRLHPVMDPLAIAIVVVGLIVLLSLRPRFGNLTRGRWAALVALRLAVVLLTLVAMLRPELVYTKVTPQRASLVLLVDDSRSMQVADSLGDASRWDSVKLLLAASADDLEKLSESWDANAYRFDVATAPLPMERGEIELPPAPTGEQSALGAALGDVLDRHASGRVLGVLLLSDGAQRAVAPHDLPPQVAARRMAAENIPLYTFTFGKSGGSDRADLAIDDLVTNETIFAEAPTEVRGQLSAQGFANQRVTVQLLWENPAQTAGDNMEVVDTVQVDTQAGSQSQPILLQHTPQLPGEYKVTLRVEPREGELVTTNNEASTFVTVRKGGVNVLYLVGAKRIGGGPGPEQRFVRAALAQSPDVVVERRLLDYQPAEVDVRDLLKNGDFDVVILDDVDARGLSLTSWQALAERVRGGAGLMMTGGYHSFGPGGFRSTPLADVLPIDIGPAQRQSFDEPPRSDVQLAGPVRMVPAAPLGVNHPIMQLEGSGFGVQGSGENTKLNPEPRTLNPWSELPPLDGANLIDRRELKPNAAVLAEADDSRRHPLLVAGQPGDGRVLAFAGDSTWRWQMQGFGDAHRRFWRQAVLWLAKKDEQTEGRVWIKLAGRRVLRGTRVDFTLGAENARGEPVAAARPAVTIETPDGRTVDVRPTRSGDHWSAIFRETDKPGDYRIRVTASEGANQLGTAEARFLVPNQDVELDRPAAEPSLMAQLAEMTAAAGGKALAPEELPTLLAKLAAEPPKLQEEVVAKTTYWDTWPFLLVFVTLLGTEWYLRKRWGLV